MALRHIRQEATALVEFREAARIGEARLAPSPALADLLYGVGSTLASMDNHADESLPYLERAIAMARATLPAGDPRIADQLAALASAYVTKHRYVEAKRLFEECVVIIQYIPRVDADLEACLPAALRGPTTRIAKIAAGLSGAGVYRVDAGGRGYVLKIAGPRDAVDGWRARTAMLRAAADAGVAPAVVHVDDDRRAVVTELVVDRSFVARLTLPSTRVAAIGELGAVLRRVHALPLPDGAVAGREPRAFLDEIWTGLRGFPLPAWTGDVVRRVLDEPPPPAERAPVLSHNDPNPSNLVYDGARLLLLDWDNAGANDPFNDLAAVAVFLRLDDATCAQLIAAHDEAAVVASLPVGFVYLRRAIAALCGAMFLHVARASGHPGARGDETFERAPTLGQVHGSMGAGTLSVRTPDGQWAFGQALLEASAQL